ncbi:MAG: hypothetical protein AB1393_09825 [Candidatus Edwardsbacteria bacterium]
MALSHPKEAVLDSDYWTAENYNVKWVWSNLSSTSKIKVSDLNAVSSMKFFLLTDLWGSLLLGYRYFRASYRLYGITGWQQWEYDGPIVYFDTLQNVNICDYRLSYHLPYLGSRLEIGENIVGEFFWTPWARTNDEINLLLRYKKGMANIKGKGWGGSIKGVLEIKKFSGGQKILTGGGYELVRVNTKGTQEQNFYGDDPGTPDENETGVCFFNIPDEIKLKQQSFNIFVSYTF